MGGAIVKWDWLYADKGTDTIQNPSHRFLTTGKHGVQLTVTDTNGCISSTVKEVEIFILPKADWDWELAGPIIHKAPVRFIDRSIDAAEWLWSFQDGASTIEQNPIYFFLDGEAHTIRLVVTTVNGCTDTIEKEIYIDPKFTYHLPNAFTPNLDGENELFLGIGNYEGIIDFSMEIWNRWGERVFLTDDIGTGWNGKLNNNGIDVKDGVYVYTVAIRDAKYNQHDYKGFVVLLR